MELNNTVPSPKAASAAFFSLVKRSGMNRATTFFLLLLLIGPALLGCGKKETVTLQFYCSETFWDVMWEETLVFQKLYGVRIEMIPIRVGRKESTPESSGGKQEAVRRVPAPWRNRPKVHTDLFSHPPLVDSRISGLIASFRNNQYGDLFLSDAAEQKAVLESHSLISHEYPFCFLTMVLLVERENPHQVGSVHEALEKGLRLGIVSPSEDGMGSVAWDIISKTPLVRRNGQGDFQIRTFDYQADLIQALRDGQIDAALAWDALIPRTRDFAEPIRLNEADPNEASQDETGDEHRVVRQSLVSLSTAFEEGYGRRFADFLISHEGQRILKKYGFAPKPL